MSQIQILLLAACILGSQAVSWEDYDVVIVGAGLSGAVLAERHANVMGHRVLVLEKRDHIAGNCFDYTDPDTGIRVSKYGMHLFHTKKSRVWDYIQAFGRWARWDHKVLAHVHGRYVNVPVNINTANALFNLTISNAEEMDAWLSSVQVPITHIENSEDMARSRVGDDLYRMLIKPYTEKQWNCTPAELDASVTARIPVRNNFDDRYFSDKYQFLPVDGYSALVQSMLLSSSSGSIRVELGTEFHADDIPSNFSGILYYTGPIDQYFSYTHTSLQYRSLTFERVVYWNHTGTVLPSSVVNHPSSEVPYTRVVEYKHVLHQSSPHTVLFYEYSTSHGEPYYPVPSARNHALYEKYRLMALEETFNRNVWFIGRLANYKYFNMDQAIDNSLHYFESYADVHVVLSVFNEDLAWISGICASLASLPLQRKLRLAWFVTVKQEGRMEYVKTMVEEACLPHVDTVDTTLVNVTYAKNVGREGLTWCTYITEVARPGRVVVFMQGGTDPARRPDWQEYIRMASLDNDWQERPFLSLSRPDGAPESGIYVGDSSNNWLLCCGLRDIATQVAREVTGQPEFDMMTLEHNYRGEFIVTGTNVLQAARIFQHRFKNSWMPALALENAPLVGHGLERNWMEIFRQARLRSRRGHTHSKRHGDFRKKSYHNKSTG